jgi:hypothetical protein
LQDSWEPYRAVSPAEFDRLWAAIVARYPNARSYLHDLHSARDHWAWPWISHLFTAGIRTNGRVESENRVTKGLSGAKKTLFQVLNALNERTRQQTGADLVRVREIRLRFPLEYSANLQPSV